jgi:glucose-1-phosphate thymidylyltransferase
MKKVIVTGALIFIKETNNPQNNGVIKFKNEKIFKIIEKPKKYISDKAITGIYYFDNNVIKYAKSLTPSKRGETEIVDLLKIYQKYEQLKYQKIGRGALWSDAGKLDDLLNISNYVYGYEKSELFKIACLEEISFKKKWINKKQIKNNIKFYGSCSYSDYLKKIIKQTI